MNDKSALALAPAEQTAITPMSMIQAAFQSAIERGAGLEVVDRILAQQREMIEYQDRVAFQAALRRIQDGLKPIAKLGWNPDTKSKFATAESIDSAIEKLLAVERMTLSFEPRPSDKPDMVFIVGILSLGAYSKEYPLEMPADGKGAKGGGVMSRTHATGSAITYGKRYLKNMIFDLRFKEKDDDGNGAEGNRGKLGEREYISLMQNIENANNGQELTRFYLQGIKDAGVVGDREAILEFENAANKRKRELR